MNNQNISKDHFSLFKYLRKSEFLENDLQRCSLCGRRFTDDRLVVHERVCLSSSKSRHQYHYNSHLHRWKGLDYHINSKQNHFEPPRISWREKHQQLQTMIR